MNDTILTLRDFKLSDASQVAQLVTASVRGHWIYTPGQFQDSAPPERFRLVTAGERVNATLNVSPFGSGAPGAFRLDFAGDGAQFSALYTLALTRLPEHAPLIGAAREDFSEQMAFFAAAGFRNAWQSWGAHLDLTRFEFARYVRLEEKLFMDGYEVQQFSNDAAEADWETIHVLSQEAVQDAPRNPTTTPDALNLDELRQMIRREETVFVARHKGQVVAFTRLTVRGQHAETEHTAVRRDQRNRGLATLLKARALAWARENGYTGASTGGTVMNLPMLKVNHRLGYLPEPMWVTWLLER